MTSVLSLKTKLNLFISSFLQITGLYFLFVKYALFSFHPVQTHLDFLPLSFSSGWRPEVEIPLYLGGYIAVSILGTILYYITKQTLSYKPQLLIKLYSDLNIRIAFIAVITLWWTLINVSASDNFIAYVVYVSVMFINNILLLSANKKIARVITTMITIINIAISITMAGLSVFVLWRIFFTDYFSTFGFIDIFQKLRIYTYFTGFYGWQFLLIALFIIVPLMLQIFPIYSLVRFFKIKPVVAFTDIVAIGSIVFVISIISPWIRSSGKNLELFVHDYIALIGPINDILGGKSILVNSYSQYGLILPYAAAIFFIFIPLSLANFFILTYVVTIVGFILIYITLRFWFRSLFAPILWIFLMASHYYFAPEINFLLTDQNTFLRYGCWVIVLFFLVFKDYFLKDTKLNKVIELTLIAVSIFWASDTGTYLLLGYLTYIVTRDIQQHKKLVNGIMAILKSLFGLCGALGVTFLAINGFSRLRSGQLPNWQEYVFHSSIFSSGYQLAPMPAIGHYLIFIILHSILVLYVIYSLIEKTQKTKLEKKEVSIIAFLTSYAIASFLYYVGESRSNDVEIVMLPSLVLLSWIAYRLFTPKARSIISHLEKSEKAVVGGIGAMLVLSFLIITTVAITNIIGLIPNRKPLSYFTRDKTYEKPYYSSSVRWLNENLKNTPHYKRKIALISHDDWYFLLTTKSTNVIDSGNNYYFLLKSQFQKLCAQLLERKPQYLFIENYPTGFTEIQRRCAAEIYHYKENIGSLDRWEINISQ